MVVVMNLYSAFSIYKFKCALQASGLCVRSDHRFTSNLNVLVGKQYLRSHLLLLRHSQIYTGPYRNPARRAQNVQENADVNLLKEGDFVAVELENYHRTPVIGKVFELNEDGFVICYWKGSYNKEWTPHTLPAHRGDKESRLWTQQLPKSCILCFGFTLDDSSKLLPGTKSYLKKAYKNTNKH